MPSQEQPTDLYPSRQGQERWVERQDPTVYAPKDKVAPVSEQQIREYAENGFMVLEGLFSDTEVQAFQQELKRLLSDDAVKESGETITEPESGDVRSIFRVHKNSPAFSTLAADKRLADLARYILNDDVYIHQSRLNYKPGFRGKEFYWHSDFETWHVEDGMPRMRALSMSITLTENFEHNGPLMLIPGSHRQYAACAGETPDNHFQASLKKQEYGVPSDTQLEDMVKSGGIVTAKCKPGSVIIFDCNIMHGSNGNITPEPRSNVFFVYNAVSNQVVAPFCEQPPRPEYICSREQIKPLAPIIG
ncbi:ectoine hydroxylase [Amphritea balenae]|uniref:Ectoine hydroxylase n=1 Tax=Amphritea balenae TaxID=452629 RepID=A0A3P1SJ70_9GAMM|nr:ectoine hydroxylase [Amphritea balenae]RRC97074.1 ectoine hydroxylase [Amphritea balenae]GGK67720.1 ectoine hydroxylase [Amphritea balenae]